jgi:hypothetical protein
MYDKSSIMDYMDESDGLLGGKLSSLEGLDSFVRQASNISTLSQKTVDHPINQRVSTDPSSHYSAIAHTVVSSSSSNSIGKKLLATMGWKLGHGIGPRMSSRRKSKKAATDIVLSSSSFRGGAVDVNDDDSSVHPAVDLSKLPVASIIDSNSRIVSFAPSEVTITIPPPKVDMLGIGFVNKDCLDGGIQSSIFGNNGTLQSRRKSRYDIGFTYEEEDVLNDMYDGEALQASLSSSSSDAKSTGALITSSSHHVISSSSSSSSKLLHYSNEVQDVDEDSHDDEDDDVRGKGKNNLGGREKLVDVARNIQNWTNRGHNNDYNDSHYHLQQQRIAQRVNKSDESDGLGYLNGFSRPIAVKIVPYHYPPPVVPLDFDDRHQFGKPPFLKDDEVVQDPNPNSLGAGTYLVNNRVKSVDAVQSRAIMLNGNTSIPATAS